jgi:DNA (cytosine-5)-methyltransferase 1
MAYFLGQSTEHTFFSGEGLYMNFKKGELFCGPGGIALGAQSAKVKGKNGELFTIQHEWANDIDTSACETYIHNICPNRPETVICQDVRKLDIESLPQIDAFSFGFPCNDYSIVGEQKGLDGEFGPLYSYGVRVLKSHHPKFFIAENVSGLQSANNGDAFRQILTELTFAGIHGYTITPHLYKFEEYGAPQKRHRIIIVGIRKDLGLTFKVPKCFLQALFPCVCKLPLQQPRQGIYA